MKKIKKTLSTGIITIQNDNGGNIEVKKEITIFDKPIKTD